MRRLTAYLFSAVVAMSVSVTAGSYQKGGFFVSMVNSVTDYAFYGPGLKYEVGGQGDWGALGAEVRVSHCVYDETRGEFTITPLEIGVKYLAPMDAIAVPYITLGLGSYAFEDPSNYEFDSIMGYHAALGIEGYWGQEKKFGYFAQVKYTKATDDVSEEHRGFNRGATYGVDGVGGDIGLQMKF